MTNTNALDGWAEWFGPEGAALIIGGIILTMEFPEYAVGMLRIADDEARQLGGPEKLAESKAGIRRLVEKFPLLMEAPA